MLDHPLDWPDDKFVGREDLLARLDEHLREPGAPLLIHGRGGAGKSAVLARHILRHVPEALVCYLNLEDSALDPAAPSSLIVALAKQLAVQLPENDYELDDLLRCAEERTRCGTDLLEPPSQTLGLRLDDEGGFLALTELAGDRPILFVLDTLDEVQRHPVKVQSRFNDFLLRLSASHISIVLAGRSSAPGFGYDSVELSVLPQDDAITLLRSLVDVPEAEARRVVELIRATPLCVRLAAGILRKHPADDAFRDLASRRTAIEGELYHRLLGYIDNPDVRTLARPWLTLRRVTPELIRQVLATPCQIPVPDEDHAHRLFRDLAREAMLVDRVPNRDEVVHRADVRAIMLPRLAEDDPHTIASIHRRAVKYYARRPDVTDRAEELYHRLMLAQTHATLDRYWDDRALPHLVSSLDELPPSSKVYLAARSGLAVSDDDLSQAGFEVQSKLLLRRAHELAAGRWFGKALSTLDSHDWTFPATPGSTDLRIQLLGLLGRHEEALDVAATAQEEAARTGDTEEFFRFTAHVLRLCELAGRLDDADTVAVNALQLTVNLPPTVPHLRRQLQLVVQRLRFARRGASISDVTAERLRTLAISLRHRLGVRRVKKVPGLLRELAAEVGEHSPELLQQEVDDAVTGSTNIEYTEQPAPPRKALTDTEIITQLKASAIAGDFEQGESLLRETPSAYLDRGFIIDLFTLAANTPPGSPGRHRVLAAVSSTIGSLSEQGLARKAVRVGNSLEAVRHYDNAITMLEPVVPRTGLSSGALEQLLIERGVLLIAIGRLDSAERDFHRAAELADDEHAPSDVAHRHLADLAMLRADLPAAIACYGRAMNVDGSRLRQAEAQLAAGLAFDAGQTLDLLISAARTAGAAHELAIAEHRAAVAAFLQGNFPLAGELARSASLRFSRREDQRWAAISALTRMRAQLAMGKSPAITRVTALVQRLRELGLTDEAAVAAALSVRVSVRRGDLKLAADQIVTLPGVSHHSPIECRMALRLCRAELAAAHGDHQGVLAEAEQGFAELAGHPDRLGTLDLPTGTVVEGLALAKLAVSSARQSDSPDLLDWSERAKADIYRYDPTPVPYTVTELRRAARRRQNALFAGIAVEDVAPN